MSDVIDEKRVLMIVDDESAQRQLLGTYFRGLGFETVEAESAEEMLEQLHQSVPDMILLDVRLPGMTGIEALPEIRSRHIEVPVVLITAYADLRQAVAAVKSGAD
ncbi:MAG: response regulator, partial [Planctomycetaceae bacterium]|nr:response regulator [Planctomycetaceae bacterium]